MKNLIFYSVLVIFLISRNSANAQDTCRRVAGFSATIQTTQIGVMVPVWIGNRFSIAPVFDFVWAEKTGTDYALGLIPKFYFNTKKLSPYICLRGGMAVYVPYKNNDTEVGTTDWFAGIGFGAEYFLDKMFSFGVEVQGNFTKSDKNSMRYGNPGNWNFIFGTLVSANVYFLQKKK